MKKALLINLDMPLRREGKVYKSNSLMNMARNFATFFDMDLMCGVIEETGAKRGASDYSSRHAVDLSAFQIIPLPAWDNWTDLYSYRFFKMVRTLASEMINRAKQYDFVWIIDCTPMTQICFALARFLKKPTVLYIRGDMTREYASKNYRGLKGFFTRQYCRYIEVSLKVMLTRSIGIFAGKELWEKYQKFSRHAYCYFSSSITAGDISPHYVATRKRGEMTVTLLAVANLVAVKGLDRLLEVFRRLSEDGRAIYLEIAGTGPEKEKLEDYVRKYGLQERVRFHGFVPYGEKLFKLYKRSHIFMLPSLSEGTPKAVFEAMAFGLPVIASKIGGLPTMVVDGREGFLIPTHDTTAMYEALRRLIGDYDLWLKMSQAAYDKSKEFTVDRQVGQLTEFIEARLNSDREAGKA